MAALLNRSKLERAKSLKKERIESILLAGLRAFERFSYAEVTLDSVRKLANVPEGKPELYFGTREELFLRVLNRESQNWSATLRDGLDCADDELSPNRLSRLLVESFQAHPEFFHLSALLPMVLEHIIDVGAVSIFFTTTTNQLRITADAIRRHCPRLSAREAVELLLLFQTYASGIYQLADPSRAMARLSAAEHVNGMVIDLETEVEAMATDLVKRFTT